MKTRTKILLINISFAFNALGRNIKYLFTELFRHMSTAYYTYTEKYDLKQFGSRKEGNLEYKWIKRQSQDV